MFTVNVVVLLRKDFAVKFSTVPQMYVEFLKRLPNLKQMSVHIYNSIKFNKTENWIRYVFIPTSKKSDILFLDFFPTWAVQQTNLNGIILVLVPEFVPRCIFINLLKISSMFKNYKIVFVDSVSIQYMSHCYWLL